MVLGDEALGAAGHDLGGLWGTGGSGLRVSYGGGRGGRRPCPRLGGAGVCWSAKGRVYCRRWLMLTRAPPSLPALSNISFYLVKGMRVGQRPHLLLGLALLGHP